jgi:hypothetical protein
MARTTLLATSALWIALTPALADMMGNKKVSGLGDVGWTHNEYDVSGGSDFDSRSIHAKGSILWALENNWNAQGNFGFNSERFDVGFPDIAVDTWHLGAAGFYRDQQGAVGLELNYQSIDFALTTEGFNLTGRGEYFLPEFTVGGGIGYNTFDDNGIDVDGWDFGLYGRYYPQAPMGITLGFTYNTWEDNTLTIGDIDGWSGRGEFEYLIPDCVTSLYAGIEFGDYEIGSSDIDFWSFGLGARFYLGTTGELKARHRSGPFDTVEINPRLTF